MCLSASGCWLVDIPKNWISYKHLSDDESLDYNQLLKEQIEKEKKRILEKENRLKRQFFQDFDVD